MMNEHDEMNRGEKIRYAEAQTNVFDGRREPAAHRMGTVSETPNMTLRTAIDRLNTLRDMAANLSERLSIATNTIGGAQQEKDEARNGNPPTSCIIDNLHAEVSSIESVLGDCMLSMSRLENMV